MSPSVKGVLSPAELTRQEATFELTDSEEKYGGLLEHIIRVYLISMIGGALLTKDEAETIFSTLSSICRIHKSDPAGGAHNGTPLHDALDSAREKTGLPNPGKLFCAWWEEHQPHELYGEYCTNLALAKHTLKVIRERYRKKGDNRLEEYLARSAELPCFDRQHLADLLDAPRRRIQRYALLLQAIQKHTPPDDSDYPALTTAIENAHETCARVDREVQERGREVVVAIQESIDMSSLPFTKQPNLMNQQLMISAEAAHLKDGKPCKLYLFKKLLIITKESKSHPGKMQIDRQFPIEHLMVDDAMSAKNRASLKGKPRSDEEMQDVLAIRNMAEGPNSTRRGIRNTTAQQGRVRYIKFSSQVERDEWAQAIQRLQECRSPVADLDADDTADAASKC